jgi:hypothetical protein
MFVLGLRAFFRRLSFFLCHCSTRRLILKQIVAPLTPQKITRLQLNLMHASNFSPVAGMLLA